MFKNQKPRVTLQSNHFAWNSRLCITSASEFKLLKSPLHKERRNPKELEKQRRVKQKLKSCETINRVSAMASFPVMCFLLILLLPSMFTEGVLFWPFLDFHIVKKYNYKVCKEWCWSFDGDSIDSVYCYRNVMEVIHRGECVA